MFYLLGTVFQTAILVMFIVPGRSLGIRREVRKAVWKTVPCPKHTAPVSAALPADVS